MAGTNLKRKRDASPKGLTPGELLKRNTIAPPWGWVLSEATDVSQITNEHLLATCGMSSRSTHRFCRNKYSSRPETPPATDSDDIIVISDDDDDDDSQCTKRSCKVNPNCLNYLSQNKWESEDDAREMFLDVAALGRDPAEDKRRKGVPVGLKNLGATCYANASLQVWFRDLAFRRGVYDCEPTEESPEKFEDSPIFQLQCAFAALQTTTQDVFNPEKLVEALQLKTTEQQDAQEFSKLFLSHLDAEFQRQSKSALKTLITDQFQGKQVYGTICSKCRTVSARDSDFLEIEISFKNNAKLEDGIATLLQEESLSGDNRYLCSTCDSLQDATRYTELRVLPPVVHFSLQRFAYNFTTMERVKSKNTITFPKVLDLTPFLGKAADRKSEPPPKLDANIYELRGVLLHKGKSAYHGHYEAQIFDVVSNSWFQFNDETVTKIKKLGDKLPAKETVIDVDAEEETKTSARAKQRENARKRQRIEDSEDELPFNPPSILDAARSLEPESRISSKDAYMLVYSRRESCASPEVPDPPPRALRVVNDLNAAHDRACEAYAEKEKMTLAAFQETRRKVLDIYRAWSVTPNEKDFVIVSQKTLDDFLCQTVIKSATTESIEPHPLALTEILCVHDRYDHKKAGLMKRITLDAYNKIKSLNCVLSPELTSNDVCRECVENAFQAKLYAKQHPQQVIEFDNVSTPGLERDGYWISKPWLRDWRLHRPKMNSPSGDPSPGADEYLSHVECEHGGLSLSPTQRCKISLQGVELLQTLFPSWQPLSDDMEPCMVCDGLANMGVEERQQLRRRAEEERAKLKPLHENTDSYTSSLDKVPCALVSNAFIRAWRSWLTRPAENIRPDRIDNESFFCEHGLLAFDPNCPADLAGSLVVIRRSDWDELEQIYSGGPLIAVEKSEDSFKHPIAVCTGCRQRRKTEWTSTEITIQSKTKEQAEKRRSSKPVSYAGSRQSTRIRLAKENMAQTKMNVEKTTTIKDIKVHVQKELKIPTICQRLFYQSRELDDNAATIGSLNIFAHSVFELRQENEVYEISDSEEAPKKKRKPEEAGFGGTLLGRSHHVSSSPPPTTPPPPSRVKVCGVCTFENEATDVEACTMCDTVFA
ncbi:hypothetical protein C8F01DRAFT_78645 [Mycena amicta]|nr:hypothetical protein C8F01DRAFT_78645 [Mycena amicta]